MECIPEASSSKAKKKSAKKNSNKGGGMKLSTDPQSVAARERRHRISDRFKILQSMVPGGSKMDTVSMLEEAIHYVKFLKTQIWLHQTMINNNSSSNNNNNTSVDDHDHHHHHHLSIPNFENFASMIPQNTSSSADSVQNLTESMPIGYCSSSFHGEIATMIDDDGDFKYWRA